MIGYLSMYRIRVQVKSNDPGQHEGIEKLMLKIGIFSSLYLVSLFFILDNGKTFFEIFRYLRLFCLAAIFIYTSIMKYGIILGWKTIVIIKTLTTDLAVLVI